jgi:hypothetical protein
MNSAQITLDRVQIQIDRLFRLLKDWDSGITPRATMARIIKEGREVTFLLQKGKDSFSNWNEWYSNVQNSLRSNPLAEFMKNTRNSIEKEGVDNVSGQRLEIKEAILLTDPTKGEGFSVITPSNKIDNIVSMGDQEGMMQVVKNGNRQRKDIPGEFLSIDFMFDKSKLPQEYHNRNSARLLCGEYVNILANVFKDACEHLKPK